jgi:hypothetical protein
MLDFFGSEEVPYKYNECANSTLGTKKEDFQTFCCDGDIVETETGFFGGGITNYTEFELDIENLVCCREGGKLLPGGIMPLDTDYTHCSAGDPVPLASMAATNTKNAELFLVTFESASELATGGMGDWTYTETPTCLWIQTAHSDVSLAEVTVPAAQITTLPRVSTDPWSDRITLASGDSASGRRTTESSATQSTQSTTVSVAGAAAPTSSAESSKRRNCAFLVASIGVCLGMLNIWMR